MASELKRCPFCGGKANAVEVEIETRHDGAYYMYKVKCIDCGASTKAFGNGSRMGIKEGCDKAIAAWNRRAGEGANK